MRLTGTRGIGIAAVVAISALLVASCSSEPEATTSASPSAITESSAAASPAASEAAAATDAAALACAAYFDLDLLNSSYAGGAVKDGDMTEQQVRDDLQAQLKELTAQAEAAVSDGLADQKLLTNAQRMKKIIKSLKKAEVVSDLTKKQQLRFAKSSVRVQKACDAAGFPLPEDNTVARTAAGI